MGDWRERIGGVKTEATSRPEPGCPGSRTLHRASARSGGEGLPRAFSTLLGRVSATGGQVKGRRSMANPAEVSQGGDGKSGSWDRGRPDAGQGSPARGVLPAPPLPSAAPGPGPSAHLPCAAGRRLGATSAGARAPARGRPPVRGKCLGRPLPWKRGGARPRGPPPPAAPARRAGPEGDALPAGGQVPPRRAPPAHGRPRASAQPLSRRELNEVFPPEFPKPAAEFDCSLSNKESTFDSLI